MMSIVSIRILAAHPVGLGASVRPCGLVIFLTVSKFLQVKGTRSGPRKERCGPLVWHAHLAVLASPKCLTCRSRLWIRHARVFFLSRSAVKRRVLARLSSKRCIAPWKKKKKKMNVAVEEQQREDFAQNIFYLCKFFFLCNLFSCL